MSNYSGQNLSIECSSVDGELLFTEYHRRAANKALDTGIPNAELNSDLHILANQTPPSHQAKYFLRELGAKGISLVHGYDQDFGSSVRPEPTGDNR